MGSCCFTPRRSQFLWWYWLLLASIVGIPMLLACWYVARHPAADEVSERRLRARASLIFWGSAILTGGLTIVIGWFVYNAWDPGGTQWFGEAYSPSAFEAYCYLVIGYLSGVALLAGVANSSTKRWLVMRVLMLLVCLGILANTCWSIASPAELFASVAVCAFSAHFWERFASNLTRRTAWLALCALVVGAFLFWAVVKYGRVGNLYLYYWTSGKTPTEYEVHLHMNNQY